MSLVTDTLYASPGAVSQRGGSLKVCNCATCGNEIVFPTSARTGRRYPAEVSTGYRGQRFYVGANVHRCAEVMAKRQAAINTERRGTERVATIADMQARFRAGTITKAEYLAAIDSL